MALLRPKCSRGATNHKPIGLMKKGNTKRHTEWLGYLNTLDWGPGHRDESGYNAFLRAASFKIPCDQAAQLVTERITANGGTYESSKIQNQARRAYQFVQGGRTEAFQIKEIKKPGFCLEKLKALATKVAGVDEQWLKSKSPINPSTVSTAQFLNALYNPGEQILVFNEFASQGQYIHQAGSTEEIVVEGSPDGAWFLINPIDGQYHPNPRQENKQSRRSEESIVSWRYLVLESDVASAQKWMAALVQVPLRIAALYSSGGKSLHALIRVDAANKDEWNLEKTRISKVMVPLGADPGALRPVQLSRLPGVMRGERMQELLYINPQPKAEPIYKSNQANERAE